MDAFLATVIVASQDNWLTVEKADRMGLLTYDPRTENVVSLSTQLRCASHEVKHLINLCLTNPTITDITSIKKALRSEGWTVRRIRTAIKAAKKVVKGYDS